MRKKPKKIDRLKAKNEILFYEEKLKINLDNLSVCVAEQPTLFYRVSLGVASAVDRRDAAKADLKEEVARTTLEVRRKAEGRITEGTVAAEVEMHPGVHQATGRYLSLKHEAELWLALKEGYQQRGYELGHLVALYLEQARQSGAVSVQEAEYSSAKRRRAELRNKQ